MITIQCLQQSSKIQGALQLIAACIFPLSFFVFFFFLVTLICETGINCLYRCYGKVRMFNTFAYTSPITNLIYRYQCLCVCVSIFDSLLVAVVDIATATDAAAASVWST